MATAQDVRNSHHDHFTTVSNWAIRATGSRWAFLIACTTIVVWALCGPYVGYSENWQLVINTATTIVTFLMVFLIQSAQNRESKAIHLKLDELILSMRQARNELIDIEHLTEEELDLLAERYRKVAKDNEQSLLESIEPSDDPTASDRTPRTRSGPDRHMTVK
jgi:low affinity Fe/Cu permease